MAELVQRDGTEEFLEAFDAFAQAVRASLGRMSE